MLKFFGNRKGDETASSESRLRTVEWKVNLILAIVAAHFLLTTFMFFSDLILPSKTTIVIVGIVLIAAGWFLRKQILFLARRMIAKQIVGDDGLNEKPATKSQTEDSII